jgi:hypothetical protein
MNRLERAPDFEEALREALRGWQAGMWTAVPAIIQSFNAAAPGQETCTAQPSIQARVQQKDGSFQWVTLPLLVDVPVMFPGGGGYTLTFPVAQGDEALIVFSSRCIDAWWQSGGVQVQAELRMHDLSDGFAFVGLKSQPRVLAGGVKTTAAQLRSDDGATYVELAAGNLVNIKAPGGIDLNGVKIDAAGNVTGPAGSTIKAPTINGTTQVIFAGKNSTTHQHGNVQNGSGISGGPV